MAERLSLRRLLAWRFADPALAVCLTTVALVNLLTSPETARSPLAILLLLLLGAPVAVMRRYPFGAACAEAALLLAGLTLAGEFPPDAHLVIAFALAYSCGAHASRRRGLLGLGALVVAIQVAVGFSEFPNIEIAFVTLPPWWVGRQIGRRRQLVSQLIERTRELEEEQDAFARLSVRRERARIARELHDIVAHHLAVIVVQAGAGRVAAAADAEPTAEWFHTIHQAGGQALAEMSRLVDILHADSATVADGRDRLRLLLEQGGAAGLDVSFTPLPGDVQLPAGVEESALRVVQEGLTNAIKHAPGAEVHVGLTLTGDTLEVEVRSRGAASGSALAKTGSGLGLTGMRERVESLGGSLEAGPDAEGGWRLLAHLPAASPPVVRAP